MESWTTQEILAQEQYIGLPTPAITDQVINALEKVVTTHCKVLDIPPLHGFSEGLYVRELRVPPGTLLTSWKHLTDHVCVLSAGQITVWSEEGGVQQLSAPYTFSSKAGSRRVGYSHSDVVWTTFHPTVETNIEKLEAELFEKHDPKHPELDIDAAWDILLSTSIMPQLLLCAEEHL